MDDGITTEQAWKKIAEKYDKSIANVEADFEDWINSGSTQTKEKPEIPKFVADWIEHIRETNKHGDGFVGINGEDIFRVIIDMGQVSSMFPVSDLSINDYEITDELVDWCSGHETEFLRALIDGYTIEKEPVWVVLKGVQYFHAFTGEYDKFEGFEYVLSMYEGHAHTFADKQKAEAVATLINGEVEPLAYLKDEDPSYYDEWEKLKGVNENGRIYNCK